ncbi:MAG: hypothetical protein GXY68_06320 [Chloroflexi bacterium]|nr:hypothetical protein [Chloroflexota bacterium]
MDQQRLWHTLSLEDTYAALNSGPRGLGSAEAERRLAEYGPNEIESAHQVSALTILWAQLKTPWCLCCWRQRASRCWPARRPTPS